jgi:DNA-binding CsgD family transcriptional regulator
MSCATVAKEFDVSVDTIHKLITSQGAARKIQSARVGKEESIIALANEGKTPKEIGQTLKLSTNVVSRYLAGIKLCCYPQLPHWWRKRHTVVARYQAGDPLKKIAAELHTTIPVLKKCLISQGCSLRPKFKLEGRELDIEAMYLQGVNISKIAAHYQTSSSTIKKALLIAGTALRTSNENHLAISKANTSNAEFFDEIKTEEQAYWLGFKNHLIKFANLFNGLLRGD